MRVLASNAEVGRDCADLPFSQVTSTATACCNLKRSNSIGSLYLCNAFKLRTDGTGRSFAPPWGVRFLSMLDNWFVGKLSGIVFGYVCGSQIGC